jgi:hypothetical protein
MSIYKVFDNLALKQCLFLLFLSLYSNVLLAGGMSAWEEKTPHGNRLSFDGYSPVIIEFYYSEYQQNIEYPVSFNKFFFDKNYIVASADSVYYIINEVNPAITIISDSIQLKRAMDKLGIKEHPWKDQNYGTSSLAMALWGMLAIAMIIVTIIVYVLLLIVRCFSKSKNEGIMKKRYLFLLSLGLSFLLILVLFIL